MKKIIFVTFLLLIFTAPLQARIDIATQTPPGEVELTVYRENDLTLVNETRQISLKRGSNTLHFDWQKAGIDPTSINLRILQSETAIVEKEISFPAQTRNMLTWEIQSAAAGTAAVEISYFITGLNWEAHYRGSLNRDESELDLQGSVKIENGSDIAFKNAKIRLLVGRVNVLDKLAELIQEWRRKREESPEQQRAEPRGMRRDMAPMAEQIMRARFAEAARAPEVEMTDISEYQLLSVEGLHDLPAGQSSQLPFYEQTASAENLYRYRPAEYTDKPARFLTFENESEAAPLPEGKIYLMHQSRDNEMTRVGETSLHFTPAGEKVRLALGEVDDVRVEPVVMNRETLRYSFDDENKINGWVEREDMEIRVSNFRRSAVNVEVYREFGNRRWELLRSSHSHEQEAYDRIRLDFSLYPGEQTTAYQLTEYRHGVR